MYNTVIALFIFQNFWVTPALIYHVSVESHRIELQWNSAAFPCLDLFYLFIYLFFKWNEWKSDQMREAGTAMETLKKINTQCANFNK